MDVLEHLEQEHRQVEQLLERLADADDGEALPLIDELERSLATHMAVEEQFLYPLVEQVVDAESEEEAEVEHDLARDGLAKLRELQDKPGFGAAVDMLKAGIAHHVREEEGELFPELAPGGRRPVGGARSRAARAAGADRVHQPVGQRCDQG
ncbi:MAG: hemerythrin domain-containing protein [Acidimicrobiales bacterium]